MEKPSYNTLCNQAQLEISNKIIDLKNEIAKLADEMATLANPKNMAKEFFASGMSFAMHEDYPWDDARAVIRDKSGESLLCYLEDNNTIKPSAEKDKLLAAFRSNPIFAYSCFVDGYLYERDLLKKYICVKNGETKNDTSSATKSSQALLAKGIDFHDAPRYKQLNKMMHIVKCNIAELKVDAVVNAANKKLIEGGGICGAIHDAAGDELANACKQFKGCDPGCCVITDGFNLPANKVIHAVAPDSRISSERENRSSLLSWCYNHIIMTCKANNLKSVAIPPIGTGIFGYPKKEAATIALRQIFDYLSPCDYMMDVVICCYDDKDYDIYMDVFNEYGNNFEFPYIKKWKG